MPNTSTTPEIKQHSSQKQHRVGTKTCLPYLLLRVCENKKIAVCKPLLRIVVPQERGKEKLPNPAALTGIKKIQHHPNILIPLRNFLNPLQRHLM